MPNVAITVYCKKGAPQQEALQEFALPEHVIVEDPCGVAHA
jgi:hypothetical protein